MSKKYKSEDLEGFILIEASIECSNCNKGEIIMLADLQEAEEGFFKNGWRAKDDNVYCQKCAKKKLK